MWRLPNWSGFKFRVEPNDGELWAIGVVAVQSAHLEGLMNVFLNLLTADDPQSAEEVAKAGNAFVRRVRLWRSLVERRVTEPHRTVLCGIIRDAADAQNERDKIMHNQFGGDPEHGKAGVFKLTRGKRPFEWALDYDRIKATALKIDDVNARILEFMFRLAGPDVPFGTALQRISLPPDTTP